MNSQHQPATSVQIQHQMEQILSSKQFRQAKSLERFLRYIVTKKLTGEEDYLKEYTIGVEVFLRGADYNPRTDAVVRVQANMLRKKLASYYEDEGLNDEIIIDLPKGHYIPEFSHRANLLVTETAPLKNIAVPKSLPFSRGAGMWRLVAIFVLGVLTAVAIQNWSGKKTNHEVSKASSNALYWPLWEKFLAPDTSTLLAYGTPQFFQFKGFYMRDVMVNSPQEIDAVSGGRLDVVRKAFKTSLDPIEVYTGVGEAHGMNTLSRFFWHNDRELKIARSRLVGWQEVKNANLIFLSSMRFHTLADELKYPNDFAIKSQGISGTIVNLRPGAGEQSEYAITGGEHYAVITLWPGKADNLRILQLSGNTTWGTLAAAEYVTDKDALHKLHEQFEQCRAKNGLQQHAPYFQVLIKAEVKDNQTISLAYVTHHDLTIQPITPDTLKAGNQIAANR